MAIEADKHVKIIFDKLERIPKVSGIELYIQLEPRAEVGIEKIKQTTTSLQGTIPDAQYEYFTHVDDDDVHDDDDDDDCGAKGSGDTGLSDTKPKAHVEE